MTSNTFFLLHIPSLLASLNMNNPILPFAHITLPTKAANVHVIRTSVDDSADVTTTLISATKISTKPVEDNETPRFLHVYANADHHHVRDDDAQHSLSSATAHTSVKIKPWWFGFQLHAPRTLIIGN
jgi:hypothetical protein